MTVETQHDPNSAAGGASALTDVLEPTTATTLCWNCNTAYAMAAEECPGCCATNANYDLASAQMEMADKSHIDHDWNFQDDSFDHEFGTERVHYWQCERCGATREMEAGDYEVDDGL